jgi:hypothetical protein
MASGYDERCETLPQLAVELAVWTEIGYSSQHESSLTSLYLRLESIHVIPGRNVFLRRMSTHLAGSLGAWVQNCTPILHS